MGKFGWSLPPGVTTLPGEEECPCDVCGKGEYDCICDECLVCGTAGDPERYKSHGMVKTQAQIDSYDRLQEFLEAEDEYIKSIVEDITEDDYEE